MCLGGFGLITCMDACELLFFPKNKTGSCKVGLSKVLSRESSCDTGYKHDVILKFLLYQIILK